MSYKAYVIKLSFYFAQNYLYLSDKFRTNFTFKIKKGTNQTIIINIITAE